MSTATSATLTEAAIKESYRYCRSLAKERAKNFYYAFRFLKKEQRDGMCAIYAFMRQCDDLSDDPRSTDKAQIQQSLSLWRMDLDSSLKGRFGDHPLWPAFANTVHRYSIPQRFFHEMIDGVMSDIEPREIETYEELYRYCYQVASVVGMTIIHIFGFDSARALLLAEKCGVAFQLTNILRDVREDVDMGRVYLPREDLRRFGVNAEQLRLGMENDRFRKLMKFEAGRAWACYEESAPLADLIQKSSRRSLWALREIYTRLLKRIEKSNYAVLNKRISVPNSTKMWLMVRAFLK
jgi:phytoene synthase